MEIVSDHHLGSHNSNGFEGGELPLLPGFRFHPTDAELITYYLVEKVLDNSFTTRAIVEVDLNKCEPWDLPEKKARMGEKEWYFFSLRDRKYPTGLRTNRATEAGYWKATGKDREIFSSKTCNLIGMKKTLVFYKGRAPKGEKSNWVMHEYRLEGQLSYRYLSQTNKDEWVVSRVFQKSTATKKVSNGSSSFADSGKASSSTLLPQLEASYTGSGDDKESFSTVNDVSWFSTAGVQHQAISSDNLRCLSLHCQGLPAYPSGRTVSSVGVPFSSLRVVQENLHQPSFFSAVAPPLDYQSVGAFAPNSVGFRVLPSSAWVVDGHIPRVECSKLVGASSDLGCIWNF